MKQEVSSLWYSPQQRKTVNLSTRSTVHGPPSQHLRGIFDYFELVSDQSLGNLRIYSLFFYSCFMEAYKIKNCAFLLPANLVFFHCLIPKNKRLLPVLALNMKCVRFYAVMPLRTLRNYTWIISCQLKSWFTLALPLLKLDSTNSLLYGQPTFLIDRLKNVQNVAALIIPRTKKYEHIKPVLRQLWTTRYDLWSLKHLMARFLVTLLNYWSPMHQLGTRDLPLRTYKKYHPSS